MADEFDVILKKLEVNVNTAVSRAAAEIGENIYIEFENVITKFYMDYTPVMYERTYSLIEGAKGAGGYGTYHKRLQKNMYECGINVGAENYSGNPYAKNPPHGLDMDPSIVFPNSWELGRHGFSRYSIRKHNETADDEHYWHVRNVPVNYHYRQNGVPRKHMDNAFKKYDNESYTNGVIIKHIQDLGGL